VAVEASSDPARKARPRSAPGHLSYLSRYVPRTSARFSRLHARVYRATGGRGVRRWFRMPVLVLETVGRRSGKVRRTPLIYIERGDDIVVIAANGGSDRTPAWWLNMREAGSAVVTLHGESWAVKPRVVEEEPERSELWSAFARVYPAIDEYTTFTDRPLPVVLLSR